MASRSTSRERHPRESYTRDSRERSSRDDKRDSYSRERSKSPSRKRHEERRHDRHDRYEDRRHDKYEDRRHDRYDRYDKREKRVVDVEARQAQRDAIQIDFWPKSPECIPKHRPKKREQKELSIKPSKVDAVIEALDAPDFIPETKPDKPKVIGPLPPSNLNEDEPIAPHRGEIGYTEDQVQKFESLGYVMTGSRNQALKAMKLARENRYISQKERKDLKQFTREMHEKKEAAIIGAFKEMIQSKKS